MSRRWANYTDEERFWYYVNLPTEENGCMLWNGSVGSKGYGLIVWDGKQRYAHRVSFLLHNQRLDNNLLIRHLCNNPLCVNPKHLAEGTHQDNSDDKVKANRQAKGEKVGLSKLTEQQVKDILASSDNNLSLSILYGVSDGLISMIRNRKRWKHIKLD
jgi:hypothetical protein